MSAPAHRLQAPSPERAAVAPARTAAARPRTSTPPHPHRRARRGPLPLFWLLSAVVVGGLLIAIVALGALIVQTSMAAAQVEDRMAKLQDRHERLSTEVADMSSPWRLASWARSAGMVVPERVVVLRVVSGPR